MKVGDLVRITDCDDDARVSIGPGSCSCRFCHGNSNRIGLVIEYLESNDGEDPRWRVNVRFDVGDWVLFDTDIANKNAEVISVASR